MASSLDTVSFKLMRLLEFLREVKDHHALTASEVLDASGVDVQEEHMMAALKAHRRVDVREDKETKQLKFAYKPIYKITCDDDLLTYLANAGSKGLRRIDVEDGGTATKNIVLSMILRGRMIVEKHATAADEFLYRRNDAYYVPLPGTAEVPPHGRSLITTHDLTSEVRRGDLILIQSAGTLDPYRVLGVERERAKKKYLPKCVDSLRRLPSRYSASSWPTAKKDLTKIAIECEKTLLPFDARYVPIDPPFRGEEGLKNAKLFKLGATNDFRDLWRSVCKEESFEYPTHADKLDSFLQKHKLVQGDLSSSSTRVSGSRQKRSKRRRRFMGNRTTNAHMAT